MAKKLTLALFSGSVDKLTAAGVIRGGAMPLTELSDWAVEINPLSGRTADLAKQLRTFSPAVVARVQNDRLLVNLRAVFAEEEALLAQILISVLKEEK